MNSVITQVEENRSDSHLSSEAQQFDDDYNTEIRLNIRGTSATITRDELMALPESILLCLFPNGVFVDIEGNVITNLTEEDVVYVNFSPECFNYIVDTFNEAAASDINRVHDERLVIEDGADLLQSKPSVIVLREDLDYYCIPPVQGMSKEQMIQVKIEVGHSLVNEAHIFKGLGHQQNKTLGPAEQHLADMLCSSEFVADGCWGHRSLEPDKTVVFSLALVRLKPDSPEDTTNTKKSKFNTLQYRNSRKKAKENTTATKLLLFWRKPARKCWWASEMIKTDLSRLNLKDSNGNPISTVEIKVHIRRVWTLELSVIGVQ